MDVFNPDTIAREIRTLHPDTSLTLANAHAWQIGKSLLEQAINERKDDRFETTLGGRTIARLLTGAARGGHRLNLWFCGLEGPELHFVGWGPGSRKGARYSRGEDPGALEWWSRESGAFVTPHPQLKSRRQLHRSRSNQG